MSDLVERLRRYAAGSNDGMPRGPALEAAVEIGALKAEIERLRTALERMALSGDGEDVFERSMLYGTFQAIARQALKEHPRNAD